MALITQGETAPDFTLSDQNGESHRLRDYRGRTVLLYFYPRDNTSGCSREACAFRDLFAEFQRHDCIILGVSPDDEASHKAFAEKNELPFPLLSDPDGLVAGIYGVWVKKTRAGEKTMGVQRATFLIDPDGMIMKMWPRVTVEGHAIEVLSAITGRVPETRAGEKVLAGRNLKKRHPIKRVALKRSANKSDVAKRANKRKYGPTTTGLETKLKGKRANMKKSTSSKATPKRTSGKAKVMRRAARRSSS